MTFYISPEALTDESNSFPFQKGALSACAFLDLRSYELHTDCNSLSEIQRLLLTQEEIPFRNAEKQVDYSIDWKDQKLVLSDTEKGNSSTFATWKDLIHFLQFPSRSAYLQRTTNETDISVSVELFGSGKSSISTGIAFFDHMLDQIAKHALLDLTLTCKGDLEVDEHHTIEDVALALGTVLNTAISDKKGLERFGFHLPMDETKSEIALDLSGRPYLVFDGEFTREYVGGFPTELVEHFFYSLAMELRATLHISVKGSNDHHKVEACFKGFARALRAALIRYERTMNIIPSSKGVL